MQCSNLCRACCAAVVTLMLASAALAVPVDGFPDPLLPPVHPNPHIGYYNSDAYVMYPQGVTLREPFHHAFTDIVRTPVGMDEVEWFNSVVDATVDVSAYGMFGMPITLAGPVTTKVYNYVSGQLGTFNAEILSMTLTGNLLGMPVMVRESPTLPSLGQTTITTGHDYVIDSFFDVFTELSLDGGQTWGPDMNGPCHMELAPEPGTASLLALAALAVFAWYRRS